MKKDKRKGKVDHFLKAAHDSIKLKVRKEDYFELCDAAKKDYRVIDNLFDSLNGVIYAAEDIHHLKTMSGAKRRRISTYEEKLKKGK